MPTECPFRTQRFVNNFAGPLEEGYEGIGATDGKEILLASSLDPNDFADKVVALVRSRELQEHLARYGREFVANYWTWEYHFQKLEEHFVSLVQKEKEVRAAL